MNKSFLELKNYLPIKEIFKIDKNELFISYDEPIKINPLRPKFNLKINFQIYSIEFLETLYIPKYSKLDKLEMLSGILISIYNKDREPQDIDNIDHDIFNEILITIYEAIINHLNPARRIITEINKDN